MVLVFFGFFGVNILAQIQKSSPTKAILKNPDPTFFIQSSSFDSRH
jgi:hypothetical protein